MAVTESWHFGLSFWMQDDDLVGWILVCGYSEWIAFAFEMSGEVGLRAESTWGA